MHEICWATCRIVVYLSFGIGLIQNASAELNYLQMKGVHEVLKSEFSYLSPIHGFTAIKTGMLANFRFFGFYGEPNSRFPCSKPYLEKKDCPQDATSSFLQRLFPSPDGVNFVANQVPSQVFSRFKPSTIGKILGKLSKIRPSERSHLEYQDQLIEELVELTYEDINPEKFKQSQLKAESKIQPYQNAVVEIQKHENELNHCSPKMKEQLTDRIGELIQVLGKLEPKVAGVRRAELKKRKEWKELVQFFETVVEAWQENQDKNSHYPSHFVEHSFLAYLWLKQNNKSDLLDLYRFMPYAIDQDHLALIEDREKIQDESKKSEIISKQNQWLNLGYAVRDYQNWKSGFQFQKPTHLQIEEIEKNPELSSFYSHSYHVNDRRLPPLVSYSQAPHKSLGKAENERKYNLYPDCGETSLRNFFNIVLYNSEKRTLDLETLKTIATRNKLEFYAKPSKKESGKEKGLLGFYERNFSLDSITDETVRDDWSRRVVSGLTQVNYLKPDKSNAVCEINAGIKNMLSVIEKLLGDHQEEKSLGKISSQENGVLPLDLAAKKFDRICELFSRDQFDLDWRVKGSGDKKILQDTGITLEFLINRRPAFSWDFQGGHFVINDLTKNQSDWRIEVGKSLSSKVGHLSGSALSTLPWYTQEESFVQLEKELLKTDEKQRIQHLIFSLPLQSNETKLFAIEKLFEDFSSDQAIKPVILRLMSGLPDDDLYAQSKILNSALKKNIPYAAEIQKKYFNTFSSADRKKEAVFESVSKGYLELLKALAEKGVDFKGKNRHQNTPLHQAVLTKHMDVIRFLAKRDPQTLHETNELGETPFLKAAYEEKWDAVRALGEINPQLISEQKDRGGKNILYFAASVDRLDIVKSLADLNPQAVSDVGKNGDNLLHWAAKGGNWDVIQALAVKQPQALSVKDGQGRTVLQIAKLKGKQDIVKYLGSLGYKE